MMFTQESTAAIAALLAVVVVYMLIIGLGIASYIMQALALQSIAKRRGIDNPWLSWIPIANYWIVGSIADEYDARNGIKRKWRVLLLTMSLITMALAFLMVIVIFALAFSIALELNGYGITDSQAFGIVAVMYAMLIPVMLVAVVWEFCYYLCIYKIYESAVPEKSVKYFILSLLVPLAQPICLMRCRDKGYAAPDIYSGAIYQAPETDAVKF